MKKGSLRPFHVAKYHFEIMKEGQFGESFLLFSYVRTSMCTQDLTASHNDPITDRRTTRVKKGACTATLRPSLMWASLSSSHSFLRNFEGEETQTKRTKLASKQRGLARKRKKIPLYTLLLSLEEEEEGKDK